MFYRIFVFPFSFISFINTHYHHLLAFFSVLSEIFYCSQSNDIRNGQAVAGGGRAFMLANFLMLLFRKAPLRLLIIVR